MPLNRKAHTPSADSADPAQKFALGLVERRDLSLGAKPQHVAQPVRLSSIELDRGAGREPFRDIEAGCRAFGQVGLLSRLAPYGLSRTNRGVKIMP